MHLDLLVTRLTGIRVTPIVITQQGPRHKQPREALLMQRLEILIMYPVGLRRSIRIIILRTQSAQRIQRRLQLRQPLSHLGQQIHQEIQLYIETLIDLLRILQRLHGIIR